jgi:hypothetical protein
MSMPASEARVRYQGVDPAGAEDAPLLGVGDHQEVGGERHHLPHHEKRQHVGRQRHQDHGGEEGVVGGAQRGESVASWHGVADAVDGGRGRGNPDEDEEEAAQPIQGQLDPGRRQ